MRMNTLRRTAFGISLLEVSLAIGIAGIAMAWFAQTQNRAAEEAKADASAVRLAQVRVAAQAYLEHRYDELVDQTVPGGAPIAIAAGAPANEANGSTWVNGMPSLQAAGNLPDSYRDRNAYGQSHAFLVRQTDPGYLEGMVTAVGGRPVQDADLGRIARKVGPFGGFLPSVQLPGQPEGTITGTFGGWSAQRGTWLAVGAGPEPGRPVVMLDTAAPGIMSRLSEHLDRKIRQHESRASSADPRTDQGEEARLREATTQLRETNELLRRRMDAEENPSCSVFALCQN